MRHLPGKPRLWGIMQTKGLVSVAGPLPRLYLRVCSPISGVETSMALPFGCRKVLRWVFVAQHIEVELKPL